MSKELQYVLYNLPEEEGKVQVIVKDETLWCTQKAMAQLFGCSTDNVSLHLKNVFNSGSWIKIQLPRKSRQLQLKNSPDGRILKSDVTVAKNYLQEKEIKQLERAVSSYFDYIENLIERQNAFNMEQFAGSVNKFLAFMDYQILPDKGKVTAAQTKTKAEQEYDIFNRTQIIDSDFDKHIRDFLSHQDTNSVLSS